MWPQPRADRLAERNQAFVELQPGTGREDLLQGKLALLWRFRVNHSPAIRDPMNVNIDGQALLIGGLLSNNTSTNTASTPGLRDTPILGRLFRSFNRNDQDTELIVVVNPVILRTPIPDAGLWTFPGRDELLRTVVAGTAVLQK